MSFLKRLGWPRTPANTSTATGSSGDPTMSSPRRSPPSQLQQGRRGRKVLKTFGKVLGATLVAVAAVLLLTWQSDYWQLRDRLVHIHDALFGDYIPPECRENPVQCTRDPKSGRLLLNLRQSAQPPQPAQPPAECKDQRGLELHCQLNTLFDYFNRELFEGRLPKALITLRPVRGAAGYFAHQRFRTAEGGRIDEIAMNASLFGQRTTIEIASTLVHEMVHLEQAHFGKPGDNGFHNPEWGWMMKRVGLYPSATGRPGGGETGTRVSHYVIPGGAFERAAAQHPILKNERLAFYE